METVADWVEKARRQMTTGVSADASASALLDDGASPIDAMRAIRTVSGVTLGEAKAVVHASLPEHERAAAESLWDDADAALR